MVLWPLVAWVAANALVVGAELPRADALVVLSGSADHSERVLRAAQLFHEGRAPRVILTNDNTRGGWAATEQRNPFFVERAAEELRRAGVPTKHIEILPQVVNSTHDEAVLLREYVRPRGLRSLLIVTSAYHSRRALWTLRQVFKDSDVEIGLSAAPAGRDTPGLATWWFSRRGWQMVAGEYLKFIYYRMHYN